MWGRIKVIVIEVGVLIALFILYFGFWVLFVRKVKKKKRLGVLLKYFNIWNGLREYRLFYLILICFFEFYFIFKSGKAIIWINY